MVLAAPERFQILSLDGGGYKGLFTAAVLANLEADLKTDVVDHFDLIVGTSIGGIIALALGLGIRPDQILQFYTEKAPAILRGLGGLRSIQHWFFRKYSQIPLRNALQDCFGTSRLAESQKRLVIPSYNLGEDDVYLFKTPHHHRLKRDYKTPLWKVALATTAAPTYLPVFKGLNTLRLIDGGVWANNPTLVGIIEAVSILTVPLKAISVFSLGTSDVVVKRPGRLNWGGRLFWANSAVDVIMRGQSLSVQNQSVHLLGEDRVRRLEPKVLDGLFALDRLRKDELLSKASHESRKFAPEFEKVFMEHKAARYEPLYR